ncbi:MAG: hypothetical protein RBU37_14605 [Myxococcota bacterium]|jgi:tetratricopeptide (TPR) repeat protein|nr:hypothetical protein [Myxococcota bacterium]
MTGGSSWDDIDPIANENEDPRADASTEATEKPALPTTKAESSFEFFAPVEEDNHDDDEGFFDGEIEPVEDDVDQQHAERPEAWSAPPSEQEPGGTGQAPNQQEVELVPPSFAAPAPQAKPVEPTVVAPPEANPAPAPAPVGAPVGVKAALPTPPELAGARFLAELPVFRAERMKLERSLRWKDAAKMTSDALSYAPWASVAEIRATLLLELALLYRDQVKDQPAAEETFRIIAAESPSNELALAYLEEVYRNREDFLALHELYVSVVERSWDPAVRMRYTQSAVEVAEQSLREPLLAVKDWERLWSLGTRSEALSKALVDAYRRTESWSALAHFLEESHAEASPGLRRAVAREVAEIHLSALKQAAPATAIARELLSARPNDPLLILSLARIYSQQGDFAALAQLAAQELPESIRRDVLRVTADALWQGGEREMAIDVYDALLALDPKDVDALRAKEQHFVATERHAELCAFLESRAEVSEARHESASVAGASDAPAQRCEGLARANDCKQVSPEKERALLLERAAQLAAEQLSDPTRAIRLWQARIACGGRTQEAYRRLAELHESLGDRAGVAQALDGLLEQSHMPAARAEILRRQGLLYGRELQDDERAEACWRALLAILPEDHRAQQELADIYRRRGDFGALDRALLRQIAVVSSEHVLEVARATALNAQEHLRDPNRIRAAWEQLLDYAPSDCAGLRALAEQAAQMGAHRERVGALEALVDASSESERPELCLELAQAWQEAGSARASRATLLRILRSNPAHEAALSRLEEELGEDERAAVGAAFELASTHAESAEQRISRLRRLLALLPEAAIEQRIGLLRRIIACGDDQALSELRALVAKNGAWEDLASVYLRLMSDAADERARGALAQELSRLCQEQLQELPRAFVTLYSHFDRTQHLELIERLRELASETGRWEDVLALLDGLVADSQDAAEKKTRLLERADILEHKLSNPLRAFEELRRVLSLDPKDSACIARAEVLAQAHELSRQLYDLYGELWDAAESEAERLTIIRKRFALVNSVMGDPHRSLAELLLHYALEPSEEVEAALASMAEEQKAWHIVLPRFEASCRAHQPPSSARLAELAQLYEEKLDDRERAMELQAEILLHCPSDEHALSELTRLARSTNAIARMAQARRFAAARCQSEDIAIELFRGVAALFCEELEAPERALDVHRRMLRLNASDLPSLDALIKAHRERGEYTEVREALWQRIEHTEPVDNEPDPRIALWLEVATLSTEHLADAEAALEAYAKILAQDEHHEEARQGINALTGDALTPELAARRLRLEIQHAPQETRAELMLELARVQADELKQPEAARQTLESLLQETGAEGPGFEMLSGLLEAAEAFEELASLLEAHADARARAEDGREDALSALHRALELRDRMGQAKSEERASEVERLLLKLIELSPEDGALQQRLAQRLRRQERWAELVEQLCRELDARSDKEDKLVLLRAMLRIQDLALGDAAAASATLDTILALSPDNDLALLHRAGIARRAGDLDTYLRVREHHAKLLEPRWAALVYCHLAEVCEETGNEKWLATHYRRARTLDPKNGPAGEALRSLGRRLKNWRASAALLPDPDERELSWTERAQRLFQKAEACTVPEETEEWVLRALAVDPDHVESWRLWARLRMAEEDIEGELQARLGALYAYERSVPPSALAVSDHARHLHELAATFRRHGQAEAAARFEERAFSIAPRFAPAALAMGASFEAQDKLEEAYELYDGVLRELDGLDAETRFAATLKRGVLGIRVGRVEQASEDLRWVVRQDPLHSGAHQALASIYESRAQSALALGHLQQALVRAVDATQRAELYHRMGKLWEKLLDGDEASVNFELALDLGARDVDLMMRALTRFKQQGRDEQALGLVRELTEQSDEPRTLAMLWVTRGEILEGHDIDEAIESYDMALSYDPGAKAALDGLERMLIQRQDWQALADLIEGRLEEGANREEQIVTLTKLADLCEEQLDDRQRANEVLRRLLHLQPSGDTIARLLSGLEDAPASEREEVLEFAVEFGSNRYSTAIDLAKVRLAAGDRLQAWAILSPLTGILQLDPEIKPAVAELHKEFNNFDPQERVSSLAELRQPRSELANALLDATLLIDRECGPLGHQTLEELTSGQVSVSDTTANGKLFKTFAEAMGLPDAELWRAMDLPEQIVVVNRQPATICIRTEIFQKASGTELNFWLVAALELAREDLRPLSAMPLAERELWAPCLLALLGLGACPSGGEALLAKLKETIPESLHDELRLILEEPVRAEGASGAALLWAESMASAERLGGLMVANLRTAWRALGRLVESIPEQRNVKTVDDLNAMFDKNPVMSRMLRFYVSKAFGSFFA